MQSKTCSTDGCGRLVVAKGWCKSCYNRQYRQSHLEKSRERNRQWKADHPERHKEGIRRWRREHPEKMREQRRRWRKLHREDYNEYRRQWRLKNPEKAHEIGHRRYAADPEKWKAQRRCWGIDNPEKERARKRRHYALRLGAGGSFTAEEWTALCEKCGNRCLSCGLGFQLHADHVIPLSKGGSNDISNLQPLCASCNSKKGTKTTDYRYPANSSDINQAG